MNAIERAYGLLALSLILITPVAFAEEASVNRFEYPADGPVPTAVVLRAVGELATNTPQAVTAILTMQAGLSEIDAQQLASYLANLNKEYMAEWKKSEVRVVCDNMDRMSSDDQAYALMDLADDVRLAVGEKYYAIAKANLDPMQLKAFGILMSYVERGTAANVLDHRAVYQGQLEGTAVIDVYRFCAERGR